MKKTSVVAAVVLFMLVAGTTSAIANRVYNGWVTRWEDGNGKCVDHKVSIDHGSSGNGWFQAEVRTEQPSGFIGCYAAWARQRDELRVRFVAQKGANQNVCLSPAFYLNPVTTNYIAMTLNQPGSPPCGSGSYSTRSRGSTKYNGSWVSDNGGLWTEGFHTLPTTPG